MRLETNALPDSSKLSITMVEYLFENNVDGDNNRPIWFLIIEKIISITIETNNTDFNNIDNDVSIEDEESNSFRRMEANESNSIDLIEKNLAN